MSGILPEKSSWLSSGNFSPPDVDFSYCCWFEVPGFPGWTLIVFLFSGSEGPERLVYGINQCFPIMSVRSAIT